MARSIGWIVVLAAGWEPPESEKAQFVAEIAEMKSQGTVQEFAFVSQNYLRDRNANYIDKTDPTLSVLATFASVPSSVLQESQLINYLRAEMPAILSDSINYDIQWEHFFHPTKKCEGLILFITVTEDGQPESVANKDSGAPGMGGFNSANRAQQRKMVQQIKGSGRTDKPEVTQRPKTLSPIPRKNVTGPIDIGGKAEINFPDFTSDKTRVADNTGINQSLQPLMPPEMDSEEKTQRMPQHGSAPSGQEWDSFLQDLGSELDDRHTPLQQPEPERQNKPALMRPEAHEPKEEPPKPAREIIHEPLEIPKETPSKTQVHRFPRLPAQNNEPATPPAQMPGAPMSAPAPAPTPAPAQPFQETKPAEFNEWSDFLNQLDGEVVPGEKKAGGEKKQAAPAPQEYVTAPQPKSSNEQEKEWKNFLNEVETAATSQEPSAPAAANKEGTNRSIQEVEKPKEEPRSDSKIFQGRGLFLTPEELALEQALKKHENKRQDRITPPGMAKMDDSMMPTMRRPALGKQPSEPLPPLAGLAPAQTVTRMNEGIKKGPTTPLPASSPLRQPPAPANLNIRQAEVQENLNLPSMRAKETVPAVAGKESKGKAKSSRRWLKVMIAILLLAGGAGYAYSYFYPEDFAALLELAKTTMGQETTAQPATNQQEHEKKFQRAWDSFNADWLAAYLTDVDKFLSSATAGEAKDKAQSQRKEILEKYEKFLTEKTEQLLNTRYQFMQAMQLLEKYNKIGELSMTCQTLQKTVQQKSKDTAEQASITAVQSIIAAGDFSKGVEMFRTFNQYQLPPVQTRLKELEGTLLKHFITKYRLEKKHREGVRYLTQFMAQPNPASNINHATLRTAHHMVALIHYHILQFTSQNQYLAAQQEVKNYEQELATRSDLAIKPSELLIYFKRFQEQIKEEKWAWEQLCRGIQKMTQSDKPYPVEYLVARGNVEKVRGKIVASKDILNTGKFQVPVPGSDTLVLYVNSLTTSMQQKILRTFSGDSQPLKIAYAHGFYLFSQGRIDDAKLEFSKAGFLQEFEEKMELCK